MIKRWLTVLLCFMLLYCSAAAEPVFFPAFDTMGTAMKLDLGVQVVSRMPFDEVRTGYLNDLLKHVTVSVRFQEVIDADWLRLDLAVDGREALTITQCESEGRSMAQLSCVPDTTYISRTEGVSALALITGMNVSAPMSILGVTQQDLRWIDDGTALMEAVRIGYSDRIVSKNAKQQIQGYGSVTRRLTLTIEDTETSQFSRWLTEHCAEGPLQMLLQTLTFTGKQSLEWMVDDSGACHKFTCTGTIMTGNGDTRKLTVTWYSHHTDDLVKESLVVKAPKPGDKATDTTALNWKRSIRDKNGEVTFSQEYELTDKKGRQRLTLGGSAELKRTARDGQQAYTGTIAFTRIQPGAEEEQLTLILDAAVNEEERTAAGTVEVQQRTGKMNRDDAVISVQLAPCESIFWQLRDVDVVLDTLNEAELTQVLNRVSRRTAQAILRPLVLLPKQDTLFLSQDLSDEAWNNIVNAARSGE